MNLDASMFAMFASGASVAFTLGVYVHTILSHGKRIDEIEASANAHKDKTQDLSLVVARIDENVKYLRDKVNELK